MPDRTVVISTLSAATEPIEGLADIWERLHAVLAGRRRFFGDEAAIQAEQQSMVREGSLRMPSPFFDGSDRCDESYYLGHRFWYRFDSNEEYFWITATLIDAFVLSIIYFPSRNVVVDLQPDGIDLQSFEELDAMRAGLRKPDPGPVRAQGTRLAVTGFAHYMHTLWNELPALDRAVAAGIGDRLRLASVYQAFGPMAELFPELATDLRTLRFFEMREINEQYRLLVGLGSRTITRSTRERLRRVAIAHVAPDTIAVRDHFWARHGPIFWISVKPPRRTCLDQSEVLARLIIAVREVYPFAGFILNGTSHPWDLDRNPNYGSWFADGFEAASTAAQAIIEDVLGKLPADVRGSVEVLSRVCVCDEIAWGAAADFYFCHGGTMQHKIAWLHDTPGMVHCPPDYERMFRLTHACIEDAPPCWFVPPALIADSGSTAKHSLFNDTRHEPDYRFTSIDALIDAVLETFRAAPHRIEYDPAQPLNGTHSESPAELARDR